MTDDACLFAAILAAPLDDAPRLALADWYDEHGEVERGEFVQCQIELARLKPPYNGCDSNAVNMRPGEKCGRCDDCRKAEALRRRERELLPAVARHFAKPAGPLDGFGLSGSPTPMTDSGVVGVVRRGFIESVSLSLATFFGGPCPRCDVSPGVRRYATHDGDWIEDECNECLGSGTTPGLAAVLASTAPLVSVTLTDAEPHEDGQFWFWLSDDLVGHGPALIPSCLFALLKPFPANDGRTVTLGRGFRSADAARAALSTACVTFARRLVGLPPLPLTEPRPAAPVPTV